VSTRPAPGCVRLCTRGAVKSPARDVARETLPLGARVGDQRGAGAHHVLHGDRAGCHIALHLEDVLRLALELDEGRLVLLVRLPSTRRRMPRAHGRREGEQVSAGSRRASLRSIVTPGPPPRARAARDLRVLTILVWSGWCGFGGGQRRHRTVKSVRVRCSGAWRSPLRRSAVPAPLL
jgi:hypothetical protein